MKISLELLKSMIPSMSASLDKPLWTKRLPLSGLEVGAFHQQGEGLDSVVIAKILSFEKHPDADKLNVCQVSRGAAAGQTLQIVCGASNVRKDMYVALATEGSVLPGDFKIKRSKIRGVESFGMLCSATELGLDEDSTGILDLSLSDSDLGKPFFEATKKTDVVLEIELTPDRADCLSHLGMAREFCRWENWKWQLPECDALWDGPTKDVPVIDVDLRAKEACPFYSLQVFDGFQDVGSVPEVSQKITNLGIRSHNAPADLTNLVMMELGQPMHAFDADKIVGSKIVVRYAKAGETLKTLDGTERTLSAEDLVIADLEKPLALAGIMGGEDSAVTESTKRIALESAYFDPVVIRKSVQRHKLHSDSSHRFERGVDPSMVRMAAGRFSKLLAQFKSSRRRGAYVQVGDIDDLCSKLVLNLDLREYKKVIGVDVSAEHAKSHLGSVGIDSQVKSPNVLSVTVPTHRVDLSREIDLIEEVSRLVGFEKIPSRFPKLENMDVGLTSKLFRETQLVRHRALETGLQEVMPYSFIGENEIKYLNEPCSPSLENPLSSDWVAMRPNLSFGLLTHLRRHCAAQEYRASIFDSGQVFHTSVNDTDAFGRSMGAKHAYHMGFALMGDRYPLHWSFEKSSQERREAYDFFDAKGFAESFFGSWTIFQPRWSGVQSIPLWQALESSDFASKIPAWIPTRLLHPGKSALFFWPGKGGGEIKGFVGEVLEQERSELLNLPKGLSVGLVLAEFQIFEDILLESHRSAEQSGRPMVSPVSKLSAPSKFPLIERDLSMVFGSTVTSKDIEKSVQKNLGPELRSVRCLDLFKLPDQSVSLSYRFVFQALDRSLTDVEVSAWMTKVQSVLEKDFGAKLR